MINLIKANRRGQNIVEYILLVAVVVTILVVFLRRHGPMEDRLEKSLNMVDQSIVSLNAEIGLDGKNAVSIRSK